MNARVLLLDNRDSFTFNLVQALRGLGAPELEISAWTGEAESMGLCHRFLPIEGVQFHPESVLTPRGTRGLANFLTRTPVPSVSAATEEVL